MGLETNFASKGPRPVTMVGLSLFAIGLAVVALVVTMLIDIRQLRQERDQIADHSARLMANIDGLRNDAAEAPDFRALQEQARQVRFFNGLIGERRANLAVILQLLETQLPGDVWVGQIAYNAETGRLSLSIRTDSETLLPPALKVIEAQELLNDVILERQLRLQQGGRQLVQFDIEAVAR